MHFAFACDVMTFFGHFVCTYQPQYIFALWLYVFFLFSFFLFCHVSMLCESEIYNYDILIVFFSLFPVFVHCSILCASIFLWSCFLLSQIFMVSPFYSIYQQFCAFCHFTYGNYSDIDPELSDRSYFSAFQPTTYQKLI